MLLLLALLLLLLLLLLYVFTRVLPSIAIDDGFVSTAAKVHLQKFWILLPHWSDVFDAWNGVLSDHMAFRWPLNGPGMAFWGILANERVKKDFP